MTAQENREFISVTLLVSQEPIAPLKTLAPQNNSFILVTLPVSQVEKPVPVTAPHRANI